MAEPIVLFGGTFNPIHHGHLIVARAVAEQLGFTRITLVPTAMSPHKADSPVAPDTVDATPADRLEMARLATAAEALFDVSDVDLQRPPPSYTCDTLQAVREAAGLDAELYWIIGADMLEDLPTWRNAEEIVAMATIITAARPPVSDRMDAIIETLRVRMPPGLVEKLASGVVETPLLDISSTDLRLRASAGRSLRYLTPDSVIGYIESRGLYRRSAEGA